MKLAFCMLVTLLVGQEVMAARFLGTVVYPQKIKQTAEIKILYKGDEYAVEADTVPGLGHYQLMERLDSKEFYVLISESLKLPNGTGFECFETSSQFPYKLFKIAQSSIMQPDEKGTMQRVNGWDIKELDNKESREIPINTIVFLLPAAFVTGLESQTWRKDDQVAWLPRVVLDASLTEERLKEGVIKMLCTLMDFKPFHARFQQHVAQVASNCVVSMPLTRSGAIG
ncbi:MAG: hypothetical protein AB7F19_04150 [Candidatus Babeliales bacterium]